MIEFETQAKKFLTITSATKISSNAQCLYFQLLHNFNQNFFPTTLKLDNMTIHNKTGLSRQQITNARNELKSLTLIDYEAGRGSASGTYTLIDLSNNKINAVIENCDKTEAQIDNLTGLSETLDKLVGENKIYAKLILQTLNDAIKGNKAGVYNNYYSTAQLFLKAKNELKLDIIYRLITVLKNKPDIQNREAYILASLTNYVKQNKVYKENYVQI